MLELYQAESCPHSTKVREKLTELGISYTSHNPRLPGNEGGDVLNQQTYDEMQAIGGQDQIPLLVDHQHGETLYGEDTIIEHLERHYDS